VGDFQPARRGDLCVIVEIRRDVILGQESQDRTDADIGVVAGIDRLGLVKRYANTWGGVNSIPARARAFVVSKTAIDVTAAFEAAKARTWPGTERSSASR